MKRSIAVNQTAVRTWTVMNLQTKKDIKFLVLQTLQSLAGQTLHLILHILMV